MMGLSAASFAPPYSVTQSPFPPLGCQSGAHFRMELVYTRKVTPVTASGPLEPRVAQRRVPLYELFTSDPDARSARAFQSGAVLAGGGPVCGRSFRSYGSHYLVRSLGWDVTTPFAVSR
jgi:hypothetical protein